MDADSAVVSLKINKIKDKRSKSVVIKISIVFKEYVTSLFYIVYLKNKNK